MRSIVGSKLSLRYTPQLKFFVDDTLEEMEHIQRLLDKVKEISPSRSEEETSEDNSDYVSERESHRVGSSKKD